MKLGALFSSGKDSTYAIFKAKEIGHEILCLINVKSRNPDSYMFHTPNVELVPLQAEAMQLPLVQLETEGRKEDELNDLEDAIMAAKKQHKIEGIVTGALFSNYQRERIEKICKRLDLAVISPLWHMDQEEEMRALIRDGFRIIFSSVAADGMDKSWLGRVITEKDVDRLAELNDDSGINIAGEGGEFESLVIDCPLFRKRIGIKDSEISMENNYTGKFVIKKAELIKKKNT